MRMRIARIAACILVSLLSSSLQAQSRRTAAPVGTRRQPEISQQRESRSATTEVLQPTAAEPRPALTLSDVEALALSRNPTLVQSQTRIQAAQGRWVQAGLYPNPRLGYDASEIGNEGRRGQQGGFVAQEIVRGNKLGLSQAVAGGEIAQAEQQFEAQRLRVLNDVKTQFYHVLIAQRSLRLSRDLLRIAEQGAKSAENLFESKEVGRLDLLQTRVELNSAKINYENAKNRQQAAWRTLAAVIGVADMPATELDGDLNEGLTELDWDESLQRLLTTSPEIAAADAGVVRARAVLARASVEPIPNLDVDLSLQHDNASGYVIGNAIVGIPFPIYNKNQGNIRQAHAQLREATAEVNRVELELQTRLARAFERYANARNQATRYASDILPDAKASLDLVTSGYRQGEYNLLMLLNAQRTYAQTNLAYLSSLRDLWESTIEIEGLLLTGSLQQGAAAPSGGAQP